MRKFDRKSMRDELIRRTQESDERKEGESFLKYFKDDIELNFVKTLPTKDEPYVFDIIPFVAGDSMPDFMKVKEGKYAYYLDIYVHTNIGPGKAWVVCPSKNYGEPCPICEYIDDLAKDGQEWDDYSDIAPKRRCVYNVINQTTEKEAKKGIQIWESSHKYSEKPIQSAAKNPRGGGSIAFSHPDREVGQSISFSVDNDTYRTISGHRLVPRDYDISDEIMEQAHKLDQIIKILSYKEIKKIITKIDIEEPAENDIENHDTASNTNNAHEPESKELNSVDQKNQCPANGIFGEEIDSHTKCSSCSIYVECANKADEIEEEKKKARADKIKSHRKI